MTVNMYLSIITLNVNGLNAPTKRQRIAEWIRKQDPYIDYLQETQLISKDTHRLKAMEWKKIFYANGKGKKAGVAVLISNKIDFKTKAVVRNKERYYVMIKGTIQQAYTPNIGAPKYTKQIMMDINGEIDINTVIAGDF